MSIVKDVEEKDFENYVSEGVTVVDFWASWCGPCRAMAPVLEGLAQKFENNVKFAKVNVDENPQLAVSYEVASIPNVCLFKNGKLIDRSIGFVMQDELEKFINKNK